MGLTPLFSRSSHSTSKPTSTSSGTSIIPLLFLLLPSLAVAADDCSFVADGVTFYFGPLKGPSSVMDSTETPPVVRNMTWTIDPCGPLPWPKDSDPKKTCPEGSHVCGIEWVETDNNKMLDRIVPVAGDFGANGKLSPVYTRLKSSEAEADRNKEGLRVEMHGGTYAGKQQLAVVEYICDRNKSGLEGQNLDGGKKKDKRDEKKNEEKSLKFISYENDVLKLEWRTKQACEQQLGGGDGDTSGSHHWGFFTWFIIVVFMVTAAYLIFGSWLNYNRYGARGWDLLPHADTLRDVPYLIKEYIRKVIQTLQGGGIGGRRAGYSAV